VKIKRLILLLYKNKYNKNNLGISSFILKRDKDLGIILVSTWRIVGDICYLGGVCDFHNQMQTSITAKTRKWGLAFLAKAKKAAANVTTSFRSLATVAA